MLSTFLRYAAQSVVAFSLITLLAGMAYLVLTGFKKRGAAGIVKALTVVTGILTAAGAILIKGTGAQVIPPDDARDTISTFYEHVEKKDFAQAFDFIHDARKQEMKKKARTYEDFAKTYDSTRDYRNRQITFDHAEAPNSRLYWVYFDVKDSLPQNTLFEESWRSPRNLLDNGILNEDKLLSAVIQDLGRYYDVPTNAAPQIREYVRNTPLHYMLEPSFIADVGDGLKLIRKQVDGVESWSHHIENLKLQNDNGWKIRSGLFPEVFSAPYPFSSQPPR